MDDTGNEMWLDFSEEGISMSFPTNCGCVQGRLGSLTDFHYMSVELVFSLFFETLSLFFSHVLLKTCKT